MILKVEHMTGFLLLGSGLLGCRLLSLEELGLGGLLLRLGGCVIFVKCNKVLPVFYLTSLWVSLWVYCCLYVFYTYFIFIGNFNVTVCSVYNIICLWVAAEDEH
jgi:hypothetical protein